MNTSSPSNSDLDFYKKFKEKYSEIKLASKTSTTKNVSSTDRIMEFRKKLESSFASRVEHRASVINEESISISPKYSLEFKKFTSKKPLLNEKLSKNTSVSSITVENKPKIEEIIPINILIEARRTLSNANDDDIRDLPYLYTFALNKLCRVFQEKNLKKTNVLSKLDI